MICFASIFLLNRAIPGKVLLYATLVAESDIYKLPDWRMGWMNAGYRVECGQES